MLSATHSSLMKALEMATITMDDDRRASSNFTHKLLVAATGAVGGAFGLLSLPVELPISTCLILRSIADIARSEGEDIRSLEGRLSCLEVFAFGGRTSADDAVNSAYFATRYLLAREVTEAAQFIVERGLAEEAPAICRLITTLASRFGMVVSDKVAAQAVPVVGAVGGAVLNVVFIDHFQDIARGHFTVRRLQRTYGSTEIERLYNTSKWQAHTTSLLRHG